MKTGDHIGCLGLASFIGSLFVPNRLSNILGLFGIASLVVAAWFGSKRWLIVVGGVLMMIAIMYFLMTHRD